jgi:hypothetical protein
MRPLVYEPKPVAAEPNIIIKGDRIIRRRKRKNEGQMSILEYEFARDSDWTKERLYELSKLTGLSEG